MWLIQLKIKTIRTLATSLAALGLLLVPALGVAQTVTQGYGTTGAVQQGMIVQLDPKNASNVEPLSSASTKKMLGVAVAANDSAVTLNSGASGSQTYVATSGKYDALVSTQNGPIKAGDNISISSLDGIGMKADESQPLVLGKALQDFSAGSLGASNVQLKISGGSKPVALGMVQVNINVTTNPLAPSNTSASVPAFLQKIATAIAGKPVNAARIYMSLAILLVSFLIAGSLLYGGVRTSLTAIGRNPLAKGSVLRGMLQVIIVGMVIFVAGLGAVFMLLKL